MLTPRKKKRTVKKVNKKDLDIVSKGYKAGAVKTGRMKKTLKPIKRKK